MSDAPIRPEEGAHWYEQDGTPRWDAGMAEARDSDLLPGQSSITRMMAKPGLENWKLNQLLLASLTLPQNKNEPLDAYAKRVAEDYEAGGEASRAMGHEIHKILATCVECKRINGPDAPLPPLGAEVPFQLAEPAYHWIDQNVIGGHGEMSVVSWEYGHAGTLDFNGFLDDDPTLLTVIDWKSQFVKDRYKRGPRDQSIEFHGDIMPRFKFYPEHPMQLGSYQQALLERLRRETKKIDTSTLDSDSVRYVGPWRPHMRIRCASGMVSTNPDHPGFAVKWWDDEDVLRAYVEGFLPLLTVWRWVNKFPYRLKT